MNGRGVPARNARLRRAGLLPRGSGLSRSPRPRLPSETERLVRDRAGYVCEACGIRRSTVCEACGSTGSAACRRVARSGQRGVPEEVMSGPANAVLLCGACDRLVLSCDPVMRARGFLLSRADPRLEPMGVARGGGIALVWRSGDGRYLYDPPEGASCR